MNSELYVKRKNDIFRKKNDQAKMDTLYNFAHIL